MGVSGLDLLEEVKEQSRRAPEVTFPRISFTVPVCDVCGIPLVSAGPQGEYSVCTNSSCSGYQSISAILD